jgi:transposase
MRRNPISSEDRQRIIDGYNAGQTIIGLSEVLQIPRQSVRSVVNVYLKTGRVHSQRRGATRHKKLTDEHKAALVSWIDDDCSLTLKKIAARLAEQFSITIGTSTINRAIHEFHFSWKRTSLIPVRRNDDEALRVRQSYAENYLMLMTTYRESQFVFLDEFGVNISMRARYGRALVGTRAVHRVPAIRSRNISVAAAMTVNGIVLFSPRDTSYNGLSFSEFVGQVCERLRAGGIQSAVLVMDNAPIHRHQELRSIANSTGNLLLFLPPYSPFMNPIENLFSKWKQAVRSRSSQNENELMIALADCASDISASDCAGYYGHMLGYLNRCRIGEIIED